MVVNVEEDVTVVLNIRRRGKIIQKVALCANCEGSMWDESDVEEVEEEEDDLPTTPGNTPTVGLETRQRTPAMEPTTSYNITKQEIEKKQGCFTPYVDSRSEVWKEEDNSGMSDGGYSPNT